MDQLALIAVVATIEAIIGGGIGMILWVGVQRRIERRDKEMDELKAGNNQLAEDLRRLREEQLKHLIDNIGAKHEEFDRRMAGEAAARRDIDMRVRDECVHRRDLAVLDDRITNLDRTVQKVAATSSGTQAIVELIASNMNISLPKKAGT